MSKQALRSQIRFALAPLLAPTSTAQPRWRRLKNVACCYLSTALLRTEINQVDCVMLYIVNSFSNVVFRSSQALILLRRWPASGNPTHPLPDSGATRLLPRHEFRFAVLSTWKCLQERSPRSQVLETLFRKNFFTWGGISY